MNDHYDDPEILFCWKWKPSGVLGQTLQTQKSSQTHTHRHYFQVHKRCLRPFVQEWISVLLTFISLCNVMPPQRNDDHKSQEYIRGTPWSRNGQKREMNVAG